MHRRKIQCSSYSDCHKKKELPTEEYDVLVRGTKITLKKKRATVRVKNLTQHPKNANDAAVDDAPFVEGRFFLRFSLFTFLVSTERKFYQMKAAIVRMIEFGRNFLTA